MGRGHKMNARQLWEAELKKGKKGSTRGNQKITVDGVMYDSTKEYKRYLELIVLERAGVISDLRRQVKYVLIPTQREPDTIGPRGGIKKGKLIEKECSYYADFVYKENGKEIVEDCKGFREEKYLIKRKLMLYIHGIRIKET